MWTEYEINYLKSNWLTTRPGEFARILNFKTHEVHCKLCELGLTARHRIENNKELIIKDYKDGMPICRIEEKYKHGYSTVSKILKDAKITLRTPEEFNQKYEINRKYFEKIDTEDKAYWLGFIYADGCITNGALQMALAKKDREHLQTLLDCMGSTHRIYTDKSQSGYECNHGPAHTYMIGIKIKELVDNLKQCGITERKSLTTLFPNDGIIPRDLIRHFIRGYFDGDGSMCYNVKRKSWAFSMVGTKEFLEKIKNEIDELLQGNMSFYPEKRCLGKNVFYIRVGGSGHKNNRLNLLFDFLYEGASVFLSRKKDKFVEALNGI